MKCDKVRHATESLYGAVINCSGGFGIASARNILCVDNGFHPFAAQLPEHRLGPSVDIGSVKRRETGLGVPARQKGLVLQALAADFDHVCWPPCPKQEGGRKERA